MSTGVFTHKLKKAALVRAASLSPERRLEISRQGTTNQWTRPNARRKMIIFIPYSSLSEIRERAKKNGRTPEEEAAELLKTLTTPWDV